MMSKMRQGSVRSTYESSQSDLCSLEAVWIAKGTNFIHPDSEESDRTSQILRSCPGVHFLQSFNRCFNITKTHLFK